MRPDERERLNGALDALTPDEASLARVRARLKKAPVAVRWVRAVAAVAAVAAVVALVVWAVPRLPGSLPVESSAPSTTAVSIAPTDTSATTDATTTQTTTTVTATVTTTRTRRSTVADALGDKTQLLTTTTRRGRTTTKAAPNSTAAIKKTTGAAGTTADSAFSLTYYWVHEGVSYTYNSAQGSLRQFEYEPIALSLSKAQLAEFERLLGLADFMTLPEYCYIPPSEKGAVYRCVYVGYGTRGHMVSCMSDEAALPNEQVQRLAEACEYIEEVLMATDAFAQLTAEN